MATKLNQIIAVEKGVKGETYSKLTDLHQAVQKAPLLSGIARTYVTAKLRLLLQTEHSHQTLDQVVEGEYH